VLSLTNVLAITKAEVITRDNRSNGIATHARVLVQSGHAQQTFVQVLVESMEIHTTQRMTGKDTNSKVDATILCLRTAVMGVKEHLGFKLRMFHVE